MFSPQDDNLVGPNTIPPLSRCCRNTPRHITCTGEAAAYAHSSQHVHHLFACERAALSRDALPPTLQKLCYLIMIIVVFIHIALVINLQVATSRARRLGHMYMLTTRLQLIDLQTRSQGFHLPRQHCRKRSCHTCMYIDHNTALSPDTGHKQHRLTAIVAMPCAGVA